MIFYSLFFVKFEKKAYNHKFSNKTLTDTLFLNGICVDICDDTVEKMKNTHNLIKNFFFILRWNILLTGIMLFFRIFIAPLKKKLRKNDKRIFLFIKYFCDGTFWRFS